MSPTSLLISAFALAGAVGISPVRAQQVGTADAWDGGEIRIGLGLSRFVSYWDEIGEQRAWGLSAPLTYSLGGVAVGPRLSYWFDVRGEPLWAVDLELMSRLQLDRVAPHLLVAIGRTSETQAFHRSGGPSMAIGAGVSAEVWRGLALRADAGIRQDRGVWNATYGLAGTWNAVGRGSAPQHADRPRVVFQTWFMHTASGEWRPVDPAFAIEFRSLIGGNWEAGVGASVEHWQLPNPLGSGYSWDTRSLTAHPSIAWRGELFPIRISAGPSVSSMGEGPESGATMGALARAELRPEGWPVMAGVGAWWIQRSGSTRPDYRAADQAMVFIQVGAHF